MKNSTINSTISILKMDNIKIIRLQSGEDIIAKYSIDEESGVVDVIRPMVLFFKRLSNGKSVMMMGPWLPIELIQGNSAKLYTQDILTVISPKESLITYYTNISDETEKTMKEHGHDIEMSLTSTNIDDDDDEEDNENEDDDWSMEEILNSLKGKITIH